MKKTFGAALMNDLGDILPYTVKSTKEQCEDFCREFFINYDKLLELGAKIVSVEITLVETKNKE